MGPRAKKRIFLGYYKKSNGCVFLGENEDGTQIEIESPNAYFLDNKFPSIGMTSEVIEFFEVDDEQLLFLKKWIL